MTTLPRISVIIPAYNYGAHLSETVESVVRQSYSSWEILIIDDESTDNTPEVCRKLQAQYPDRLRYQRVKNGGLAAARNTAVPLTQGEFLFPLDADDLLHPEAFEELVRALDAAPHAAFSYCAVENFGGVPDRPRAWFPGVSSLARHLWENTCVASSLWRRSCWDAGVRYRNLIFEDWDFWVQVRLRGGEGVYVPRPLFRYRQHIEGLMGKKRFLYYPALYEIATNNAEAYPSYFVSRAAAALTFSPECWKKTSIVFLPHPEGNSFFSFSQSAQQAIEFFLSQEHFCAVLGGHASEYPIQKGLALIHLTPEATSSELLHKIGCLGPRVLLYSEREEGFNRRLSSGENILRIEPFPQQGRFDVERGREVLSFVEEKGEKREQETRKYLSVLASLQEPLSSEEAPYWEPLFPVFPLHAQYVRRFLASLAQYEPKVRPILIFHPQVTEEEKNSCVPGGSTSLAPYCITAAGESLGALYEAGLREIKSKYTVLFHPRSELLGPLSKKLSTLWRELPQRPLIRFAAKREFPFLSSEPAAQEIPLFVETQVGALALALEQFNEVELLSKGFFDFGAQVTEFCARTAHKGIQNGWAIGEDILIQWMLPCRSQLTLQEESELLDEILEEGKTAPLHQVTSWPYAKYPEAHLLQEKLFSLEEEVRVSLLFQWACQCYQEGQYDSCRETLLDLLSFIPYLIEARSLLALTEAQQGALWVATHHAKIIVAKDPENAVAREILGLVKSS